MIDESELSRLVRAALPARPAPPGLREWAQARARLHSSPPEARSDTWRRRTTRAAAGWVLALSLGVAGGAGGYALLARASASAPARRALVAELVDSHVGSLKDDHLIDVRSSDQHTVKPWFAGRVDFAPRVAALDSLGFPLLGGRSAYLDGHDAAVLVYGRRQHVINLFVWRDDGSSDGASGPVLSTERGYSLAHWTSGGLTYWAVSDAAPAELRAFHAAYTGAP